MNPNIYYLIPIFLGLATILQTQILKLMGIHFSLIWAALINNLTGLVILGIALLFFSKKSIQLSDFSPFYLLAGVLGVAFVIGAPFAVAKIGPAKFFIILVASEIVLGMIWQYFVDPSEITNKKILACLLVTIGAWLVR